MSYAERHLNRAENLCAYAKACGDPNIIDRAKTELEKSANPTPENFLLDKLDDVKEFVRENYDAVNCDMVTMAADFLAKCPNIAPCVINELLEMPMKDFANALYQTACEAEPAFWKALEESVERFASPKSWVL